MFLCSILKAVQSVFVTQNAVPSWHLKTMEHLLEKLSHQFLCVCVCLSRLRCCFCFEIFFLSSIKSPRASIRERTITQPLFRYFLGNSETQSSLRFTNVWPLIFLSVFKPFNRPTEWVNPEAEINLTLDFIGQKGGECVPAIALICRWMSLDDDEDEDVLSVWGSGYFHFRRPLTFSFTAFVYLFFVFLPARWAQLLLSKLHFLWVRV